MSQQFTGAGVALVTPFTNNNQVDYKSLWMNHNKDFW